MAGYVKLTSTTLVRKRIAAGFPLGGSRNNGVPVGMYE